MSPKATVERFLKAFYSGDVRGTRAAITDDFTLVGPFATVHSADGLFVLAEDLLKIVRGHSVRRWVIEGDNVAALYEIALEGAKGPGLLMTGGWFTVFDGKVSGGQIIYDSAAFDAVVEDS